MSCNSSAVRIGKNKCGKDNSRVLDHPPLHPHSLEVLRQEYLTERVQYDHFALELVAEKVQESAPGKAHLQSQVDGGYDLE